MLDALIVLELLYCRPQAPQLQEDGTRAAGSVLRRRYRVWSLASSNLPIAYGARPRATIARVHIRPSSPAIFLVAVAMGTHSALVITFRVAGYPAARARAIRAQAVTLGGSLDAAAAAHGGMPFTGFIGAGD